jgi:hypothetical protein
MHGILWSAIPVRSVAVVAAPNCHFCAACNRQGVVAVQPVAGLAQRLTTLGTQQADERISPSGKAWVIMRDPEGNEFCVD